MGSDAVGEPLPVGMLRCASCGCVTLDSEPGWRALHAVDERNRLVLLVYCPACWDAQLHVDDE